jgi:hypothetical protein
MKKKVMKLKEKMGTGKTYTLTKVIEKQVTKEEYLAYMEDKVRRHKKYIEDLIKRRDKAIKREAVAIEKWEAELEAAKKDKV